MQITLIRHGQTDWNSQRKLQGATDIPLNETGREQARTAGRTLPREFDVVTSSPLGRARETAELLAAELGLTVVGTHPEITERSFGEAEGKTGPEVLELWPDRNYPGMEPQDALVARGIVGLDRIAATHPGERVLAVSHGALIRLLAEDVSGTGREPVANLEPVTFERVEGSWRVVATPDAALSA
ncbi:histidine phosphatase family protein [Mycetocola tolaasinivorans]|uniref:Histidine phosphatase family protein n=1 Tax=Mycetocola tolaasinivorans TaxID=76635 RepID=A0A3L7A6E4_9MICO|nr:histidine phosphatase family protein [Mycetocola tolaasinivorans]RLP75737.1 histidine phosphatase family protein [Mycetocola tolaasinivorans]